MVEDTQDENTWIVVMDSGDQPVVVVSDVEDGESVPACYFDEIDANAEMAFDVCRRGPSGRADEANPGSQFFFGIAVTQPETSKRGGLDDPHFCPGLYLARKC